MRLLLCEDEEDILFALSKGLRKLNYYVDTAMDGEGLDSSDILASPKFAIKDCTGMYGH